MIKNIFVFDLDDTLGPKTPLWTDISRESGTYLMELGASPENLLCIATSRPRSIISTAFKRAGINPEQQNQIFPIMVSEDGFLAVNRGKIKYNQLDYTPHLFQDLRRAFYDSETLRVLKENNFLLISSGNVTFEQGRFILKRFGKEDQSPEILEVPEGVTVIQGQNNDVKQVIRSYLGFENNDLKKQKPFFEKLGQIISQIFDKRFPNWQNVATLYSWDDAIDLYPLPKEGGGNIFFKGQGLEYAIEGEPFSSEVKAYVCGDGKNDIQMVEWAAERFPNYRVVCPSNLSQDLKSVLEQGNYKHTILEENCKYFCQGLKKIIEQ